MLEASVSPIIIVPLDLYVKIWGIG